MSRAAKPKKPKPVTVEFIPRERADGTVAECYRIAERIIATERADLAQAAIGFAWRMGWTENAWGQLTLGKCQRRNDLDRSLDRFDFVILLNAEAWPTMTDTEREQLIYHQLLHATIVFDDQGDERRDEAGRLVTKLRPHDIAEFRQVVERYGDEDLAAIAMGRMHDAERPLLAACGDAAAADEAQAEAALQAADGCTSTS